MIDELRRLVAEEACFPVEAYLFLYEALDRAQRSAGSRRHVSGPELLEGIRLLAIERFGPLAKMVLDHWKVTKTADFGLMVFHLVDRGLMGKTDDDCVEDFTGVFEFSEAFDPAVVLAQLDAPCTPPATPFGPGSIGSERSQRVSQG